MKPGERIVLVYNGNHWFARHLRVVEHDLDRDEKVYRCDAPIGGGHATLEGLVKMLEASGVGVNEP
ncbi:MAG TPA: hypothetical protein VFA98_09345 [Thermoanaerobaculia bacterium]|nr:hypothetical protein [Thermoanaerobaculia bacterium]